LTLLLRTDRLELLINNKTVHADLQQSDDPTSRRQTGTTGEQEEGSL
jgi:hypothetical protein